MHKYEVILILKFIFIINRIKQHKEYIAKHYFYYVGNTMAFRGTSTLHVRLMLSLANELGSADLEALKGLCKSEQYGGFGAGQLQKITTISELLNKLQAKRIFKEGDYTKLKELLVMIDNEEAKQNVEEAEKNFQSRELNLHYILLKSIRQRPIIIRIT